jgi:ATP-dependent protease HslVU (ClpYQ) peptidase subunit
MGAIPAMWRTGCYGHTARRIRRSTGKVTSTQKEREMIPHEAELLALSTNVLRTVIDKYKQRLSEAESRITSLESELSTLRAASEWRTDEPLKDGTPILAVFDSTVCVARWIGLYGDESEPGDMVWFIVGSEAIEDMLNSGVYYSCDPDYWAYINHPEGKE